MKFDEVFWSGVIQRPDWPAEFVEFAKRAQLKANPDGETQQVLNKQVRHFFEKELLDGRVCLGQSGPDFDAERLPIDKIIIHHTSAEPGYRQSYLNATQLLNIYAPVYAVQRPDEPVWSGHFHKGKQVFWGYHWLMRMDGCFERLLDDNQVGWHAGDWNANCRSIGICLDNDYENRDPSDELLKRLAVFIKRNYPRIKPERVIGHREVRRGTICPGKNFLDSWKSGLISYLS